MIDFRNGKIFKLKKCDVPYHARDVVPFLVEGERIFAEYKAIRDYIIFTNLRIIAVNVKGFTGQKISFTSLPFSKVSSFSVESAGMLDLDSELELFISGMKKVKFELSADEDIMKICKFLSDAVI